MRNIIITAGLLLLFASCTKQEMPQPTTKQTDASTTVPAGANARLAGTSGNDNFIKDPSDPTPPPPPPPPPTPAPTPRPTPEGPITTSAY